MSTGMTRLSTRILKEANSSAVAPPPEELPGESDFVVILAAMLCALICVVGLIAVARCAWLRRGGASAQPPPSRAANRGLKKKVVESLPKFTYTAGSDKFTSSQECAICLGEFVEGDEIRVLPKCRHEFHVRCIDRWLGSHSSCPSCRQLLVVARCNKCGGYPAVETCGITPTGDPNANSHAHGSRTFFLP